MKMNKFKTGLLCIVACAAVFMAAELVFVSLDGDEGEKAGKVSIVSSEDIQPVSAGAGREKYILKAYGGYAAVFTESESEPVFVTDISLDMLRDSDRALIEKGITVYGETEILKLIEDFNS